MMEKICNFGLAAFYELLSLIMLYFLVDEWMVMCSKRAIFENYYYLNNVKKTTATKS